MQDSHQDGRRVRNVPIRIERDVNGVSRCNTEPRRGYPEQNNGTEAHQTEDYKPKDYQHQNYAYGRLNEPNQLNQRTPPHTSSINIHYKPQPSSYREQQLHQQHKCNNQYGGRSVSPDEPIRRAEISSRLNAKQQQQQSDRYESPDKENAPKSSNDCPMHETNRANSEERKPSPIPPVIPLPPPPSQMKPAVDEQVSSEEHPIDQDQKEEYKEKKAKQPDAGPIAVINATKADVNRLLQEVAKCDETSTKSKEFLRLEELLTLCILKLDNIEAGSELRQQRKEVINMINKCTDILERKVNLNNEIQQLAASCQ